VAEFLAVIEQAKQDNENLKRQADQAGFPAVSVFSADPGAGGQRSLSLSCQGAAAYHCPVMASLRALNHLS